MTYTDLPPRIWAVQENGEFEPLEVDKSIHALAKSTPYPNLNRSLKEAQRAVRRAIEVAHLRVFQVKLDFPGPIASDFESGAEVIGAAASALSKALYWLEPKAANWHDYSRPILTAQAGLQEGSAIEFHRKADEDALALLAAHEVLQRLESAVQRKSGQSGEVARTKESRVKPHFCGYLPKRGFILPDGRLVLVRTAQRTRSLGLREPHGPIYSARQPRHQNS
jgi:hypothetical protein